MVDSAENKDDEGEIFGFALGAIRAPHNPADDLFMARFDALNGRSFTATQVCMAAHIDQKVLANWLHAHRLILVSPPTSRGRPRQFSLLDVYLLAVLREMVRLTGAPSHCANVIWRELVWPVLRYRKADAPENADAETRAQLLFDDIAQYFADLLTDIRAAGAPWMFDRRANAAHVLFIWPEDSESGAFLSAIRDMTHDRRVTDLSGYPSHASFDLSAICRRVDEALTAGE